MQHREMAHRSPVSFSLCLLLFLELLGEVVDEGTDLTGFKGYGTGRTGLVFGKGLGLVCSAEGYYELESFIAVHGVNVMKVG